MEEISLEKHIENLKKYIKEDVVIEKDNSDFAQYCKGHCEDIQAVLDELDRRIKPEVIEEKIKEYEGLKEMDMQAYEEQVKPLKELLNKE